MAYQLDGVTLKPGRPFETNDGTQYPGDWLDQSTPVERAALGIVWVAPVVEPYYDQRFYWGPSIPKDIEELKTLWVGKQKDTAGSLLSPSDWYIVRMTEHPECMCPPDVVTYRDAVRSVSNIREEQIKACVTTDELASLITAPTTIVVVVTPYSPPTFDEKGVELTPEIVEITEIQPNPEALEPWPV